MRKEYDIMLNLLTRHTNITLPYSDYVKSDKFPEQISELLNTEVTIKYRNHYMSDISLLEKAATVTRDDEVVTSRPSDDVQQLTERKFIKEEEDESPLIYEGKFRVIRADKEEPYRLIGISSDYKFIIVNSTKTDDDGNYEYESIVSEYATQLNEYIGLGCYDQYAGEIPQLKAATMRVDATEPCYSILMEFLGSTNVVRFILGDEALSILYDYYDTDGSRDYDNRYATEEENPVDVTGEYADADQTGIVFTDVNGGIANNWKNMYQDGTVMRDFEIYNFRKSILEGKIIYGTV